MSLVEQAGKKTPLVTAMRVIPVAGRDSMLLNLSGAHAPFFTRNLVLLDDSAGHMGVGEVPGGEKIRRVLESTRELVEGQSIAAYRAVMKSIQEQFAGEDAGGRGLQTFDQRTTIHAGTAIESAMLDLLGQFLGAPVCDLLGEGRQRSSVDVLGYLFYIGDRRKCDLGYRDESAEKDEWFHLRNEQTLTTEAVLRLAAAAQARYGFRDFKLKAGVLEGAREMEAVGALAQASRRQESRLIRTVHGRSTKRFVCATENRMCWRMPKIHAEQKTASPAARSWLSFAPPRACRPQRI